MKNKLDEKGHVYNEGNLKIVFSWFDILRWILLISEMIKSSHPELFCKKGVLKNLTKFKGKRLRKSLFFNKVAGLRPETLLKKRL